MKKFLHAKSCVLIIAISILNHSARAQDFEWAKSAGGAGDELGNAVAADANGNVYVTGIFMSSSIIFHNKDIASFGIAQCSCSERDG